MDGPTMTLTAADNGTTIDVRVGDTVLLRLRDRPGGFTWKLDGPESALVEVREVPRSETERPRTDGPVTPVGGPSDMKWTLTARAPGTAQVTLKLWRKWEGDASVQTRFGVTLRIKP